jgi:hypothetical protein
VPAASSAGGTANIVLYSVNSDGPDFRAVVTGAIGDYGPAVTVRHGGHRLAAPGDSGLRTRRGLTLCTC